MFNADKLFVIGDTHFQQGNILAGESWRQTWAKNIDDMTDHLIAYWNTMVENNDIVLHVGDFGVGDVNAISRIIRRLNGRLIIVPGNHDDPITLSRAGAFVVKEPALFNCCGQQIAVMHSPLDYMEHTDVTIDTYRQFDSVLVVHGHTHGRYQPHPLETRCRFLDVGIDATRRPYPQLLRDLILPPKPD